MAWALRPSRWPGLVSNYFPVSRFLIASALKPSRNTAMTPPTRSSLTSELIARASQQPEQRGEEDDAEANELQARASAKTSPCSECGRETDARG